MTSIWFVALRVDGERFVIVYQGTVATAVFLYIDDLLIIANECLIGQIKDWMKRRFWMHDIRGVSFYLSMNIQHNQEHHMINIHQRGYIRTILAKVGMNESGPIAIPMAMKLHKRKPNQVACDPTI